MAHFCVVFLFPFLLSAMEISPSDVEIIGQGIFHNECGGRTDRLVWWNEGENFASLGIGHFIWYPKGIKGPFEETFPSLLAFLMQEGTVVPDWLKSDGSCPWSTKEEFSDPGQNVRKRELRDLLSGTIALQTAFIAKRFEMALQKMLSSMSDEKKRHASLQIERLKRSRQGKFALIDYLNFKGDGTLESERYKGKGWGLKQVLEAMPSEAENPLEAFAEAAKDLLKQRVENSLPKRQEQRWLKGWLSRIDRYLKS